MYFPYFVLHGRKERDRYQAASALQLVLLVSHYGSVLTVLNGVVVALVKA